MFSPARLREAREAAGRTQVEAALAASATERTIRSWEKGKPPPNGDELAALAALYGVPVSEFFIHGPESSTDSDGRGKGHEPDTAAVGGSAGLAHEGA